MEAYIAADGTGLHHYDPVHHALERVRAGDHRASLTATLSDVRTPPDLVLVLAAAFWRTGFRYGEYAYVLQCQETGALAAQFAALSEQLGLAARLHLRFDGSRVDRLLGLTSAAESALAVLSLSRLPGAASPGPFPAGPVAKPRDEPRSVTGLLPHLLAVHSAAITPQPPADPPYPLLPLCGDAAVSLPAAPPVRLSDGIRTRRSAPSGFERSPLGLAVLAGILAAAGEGYRSDLAGTERGPRTCELAVWVRRVDGVRPGVYRYGLSARCLEPVAPEPDWDRVSAPLPLSTRFALDECAAVLLPAADPPSGPGSVGATRFRLVQTETGMVVHRAALAASALGLTARIHSEICDDVTARWLGPVRPVSALLLGEPPRRRHPTRTASWMSTG